LNFVHFLITGRFRSPVDRLLGLGLVYRNPKLPRAFSFEFMNQQLVWAGFSCAALFVTLSFAPSHCSFRFVSDFLLFILPLINLNYWRIAFQRFWRFGFRGQQQQQQQQQQAQQQDVKGPLVCAICHADPICLPYRALPCGHIYDYYCLNASRLAVSRLRCLVCDQVILSSQQVTFQKRNQS
jgi:peroxin-2